MVSRFELVTRNTSPQDLIVVSFRGVERVSRPFRFQVVVRSSMVDLDQRILGETATLTIQSRNGHRGVSGIITGVRAKGFVPGRGDAVHSLRLVPRLWTLGLGKNTRIFQDKTVPEVVTAVLTEAGVEHAWRTHRAYPKRDYCVQYDESDLAFVERLLADEGIFYFTDVGAGSDPNAPKDAIVLSDNPSVYDPIPGSTKLRLRDEDGMVRGDEHVHTLTWQRRVRTGAVKHVGFDVRRPSTKLSGDASAAAATPGLDREAYEHDMDWSKWHVSSEAASVHLEQRRLGESVGNGKSGCVRLAPGQWFELEDSGPSERSGRLVPLSVEHRGRLPEETRTAGTQDREVYANRFTCVDAAVALRPPRPIRKHRQITETATVVGPAGEEIHTDSLGRIKVQFHWDRQGHTDDKSSCWMRVMQPWAGSAWGSQFIPRVGMEVVVTFLGGNTDRPLILGALYNGENPLPFQLPAKKTQSGIRTRSTPGGAGYNELRFEDAAGQEEIHVHAQRDLIELVEHDRKREVRGEESIRVVNKRTLDVLEDNVRNVHGSEVVTIQKNLVMHVVGAHVFHVEGAGGGGGGGSADTLADEHHQEVAPKGGSEDDATVLAQVARTMKRQNAKLVWQAEQLEGADYAWAAEMQEKTLEMGQQIEGLYGEARALAGTAPRDDMSILASPLLAKTDGARDRVSNLLTQALEPQPSTRHRVQQLAIEHLQEMDRLTHETDAMLSDAIEGKPPAPPLTGFARGGGGGEDVFTKVKDKATNKVSSQMHITGGGTINSPDGFQIKVGGSFLDIKDGKVELKGPGGNIVIDGGGIRITGTEVDINQ